MPDRDTTPDPLDGAYVRAEALLSDDEARAARRARILAAVAEEPGISPAPPFPFRRRPAMRYGGWLAAASVVGLSVIVATRLYEPEQRRQPPEPAPLTAPTLTVRPDAAARAPAASPRPSATAPRTPPAARKATTPDATTAPSSTEVARVAPLPAPPPLLIKPVQAPRPLPPAVAQPYPRYAAAPAADSAGLIGGFAGDVQVEAARRRPAIAPPASEQAERLRAAAAAGRTAEVEALLTQGVSVDAPDSDGETALMKSIEADHPAVAALLRRHGASLDARNHAGERAGDMALAKDDPELDAALGLGP